MFERFDESARNAVVTAHEAARELGHTAIGGEHLLVGVSVQDGALLNVRVDALRSQVVELFGTGDGSTGAGMAFTPSAKASLELAAEEAADHGHGTVRPAHLLLALLRTDERARTVAEALGRPLSEIYRIVQARAAKIPSLALPTDDALRMGHPVTVTLGDELPVGALGNRRADARVLAAMLVADGPAAKLLRAHGVEEGALKALRSDYALADHEPRYLLIHTTPSGRRLGLASLPDDRLVLDDPDLKTRVGEVGADCTPFIVTLDDDPQVVFASPQERPEHAWTVVVMPEGEHEISVENGVWLSPPQPLRPGMQVTLIWLDRDGKELFRLPSSALDKDVPAPMFGPSWTGYAPLEQDG